MKYKFGMHIIHKALIRGKFFHRFSPILGTGELSQATAICNSHPLHTSAALQRDILCERHWCFPLAIQHIHVVHGLYHQAEGTPDFCPGARFG